MFFFVIFAKPLKAVSVSFLHNRWWCFIDNNGQFVMATCLSEIMSYTRLVYFIFILGVMFMSSIGKCQIKCIKVDRNKVTVLTIKGDIYQECSKDLDS